MPPLLIAVVVGVLAFAALTWAVPALLRPLFRTLLAGLYRFRVHHRDRIPATGPALVLCNHVSFLDWMILWAAIPRRVTFVLWAGYDRNILLRFFLSWVRHRSIRIDTRTNRPHAMADALTAITAAFDRGECVVLFPEGRLTRTGQMWPFGRGFERAVRQAHVDVPIVPTCIAGMWGSVLSHRGGRIGRKLPAGWRRSVAVWFAEPLAKSASGPDVRAAVAEAMADLANVESYRETLVPNWFVRTACQWRRVFRPAIIDVATGTERKVSFGKALVGAWCLADWLRPRVAAGDVPVGIWLPTGLGSTLANIAVAFLRRTTVNLNFTAGEAAVTSAARQVGMTHVLTARKFEQKMPLPLPADIVRIYIEDAAAAIPGWKKFVRFLLVLALPGWLLERILGLHHLRPDDLLTIIFSSGSTGEPKGVMLTHRNIASNAHAFHHGVELDASDRMLATLPVFHSFGYTVCLWAPVGIGMAAIYYPDPRAAKEVGELCRKYRATIMLSTATFMRFYLRRCAVEDFRSVRLLLCGAEKLPVKLAREFEAKFAFLPLEGYGCTETSPVVCVNMPDANIDGVTQQANRMGTVGQPIPGVVAKAFHADTLEPLPPGEEGVLWVKGPNIMLGYHSQPEKTAKVIRRGYYNTGDVGLIEPDGFIRITGRISRFAKIAGEMVPLEKLEEEMQELFGTGERLVAVCPVPCEKRGERLIVLYLPDAANKLDEVLAGLPKRGLPNLWVPARRDCYELEAFPALGTGKLDLKAVGEAALAKSKN